MFPAYLGRGQTSLLLLDHPDNLRLGETAFSHVVWGQEYNETTGKMVANVFIIVPA